MRVVTFRLLLTGIVLLAVACDLSEDTSPEAPQATAEQAVCTYPTTTVFGVTDSFSLITPDPIPYGAPAYVLPQFDAYLTSIGVTQAIRKTFDSMTANRHMVATLRHGLRGCFAGASSLTLCFRARAHADVPGNDAVAIYNTDFGVYSFPVIYASALVPSLTPTWTSGMTSTLCINLTPQMLANQVGDMLQFRLQDDSAVDAIAMILN